MKYVLMLLLTFWLQPALAVTPSEQLQDQKLENRAREISKGLRCLVCQNQSIDDSDAGLAKDLRILVRERLVAGDSNQEVINFVVERYGDFVLLSPPLKPATWLLWLSPILLLAIGIYLVRHFFKGQKNGTIRLSEEEKQRLAQFLEKDG